VHIRSRFECYEQTVRVTTRGPRRKPGASSNTLTRLSLSLSMSKQSETLPRFCQSLDVPGGGLHGGDGDGVGGAGDQGLPTKCQYI